MRRLLQRFGLVVLAALSAPPAGAHAFLDQSVPAVGSVVRVSPTELTLRFTQRLEPAFSRVRVFDSRGKQVDRGDSQIDAADATLLRVTLPVLSSGRYRVTWRVLSIDTHVSKGDFTFDVAP